MERTAHTHSFHQILNRGNSTVEVLMYHRVCSDNECVTSRYIVSKSTFRKQMEFLAQHGFYTPRGVDVINGTVGNDTKKRRPIVITFDDGYLDNYENAFPVLQELGFTAIIFLVPDFSRTANWWDGPGQLRNSKLLRPRHIQHMWKSGIQFGSHSFSHPSLPCLADDELDEELRKAKAALEEIVQQPFSAIAYPYGDVNERVKNAVKRAGYNCGFAAHTGPLRLSSDLFEIRRVIVTNRSDSVYLNFTFSGADHFIRWGLWRGKKLIGKGIDFHRDS